MRQLPRRELRHGDELGRDIERDDAAEGTPEKAVVTTFFHLPRAACKRCKTEHAAAHRGDQTRSPPHIGGTDQMFLATGTAGATPRRLAPGTAPPGWRTKRPSPPPWHQSPDPPCGTNTSSDRRPSSASSPQRPRCSPRAP